MSKRTARMAGMSIESDSQSTVHYAKPVIGGNAPTLSPMSSSSSTPRSPNIRYPTVVVHNNSGIMNGSPKSGASYAVPVPRNTLPPQYSASQLKFEHVKHRCKMLDEENQKLMKMQADVVNDANRRVQMHVNEIRMLKEENRKMQSNNKELRDLCCFLDDDRQKTRKLAREWQKFGRYTSNLMKHEIQSYHQKLTGLEEKLSAKDREVEELRQLCMYLDEQRQYLLGSVQHQNLRSDDESEDLGCGSSEQSSGSTQEENSYCFNKNKESTLRRITQQMTVSMVSSTVSDEERKEASKKERSRLVGYIQSLENRIKHLEMSQNHESYWNSASDCDERTIIERSWNVEEEEKLKEVIQNGEKSNMLISMTSSGCTTYASSGADADSVFVMGDEIDIGNLEVRTLSRIEEEGEKTLSTDVIIESSDDTLMESAIMPPRIAPVVCSSLMCVSNLDDGPVSISLMRSASENCRPSSTLVSAKGCVRSCSVEVSNNNN